MIAAAHQGLTRLPFPDLSVGEDGVLCFAGQSTAELAKKYGTPLYLMNEDRIRANCRRFLSAAHAAFEPDIEIKILYASKAASFRGIYRIIADEQLGIDVVSPGEIYTAMSAEYPLRDAFFHSNNKTDADIGYAIERGVGHIVADGADEIRAVSGVASLHGVRQKILIRITPGIDPHTFEAVSTGRVDSKFGCAIENGQAAEAVKLALSLPGVELDGFHCHVGSGIFDADVFMRTAQIMLDFISDIHLRLGYTPEYLDLGGGFGVPYTTNEQYPDIEGIMRQIAALVRKKCAGCGIKFPTVCFEPGRAIVADAGMTLYTVGSVKRIPGYRNYVSVDGGMTDNPRFALYRAPYTVLSAIRPDESDTERYSVVGRCCESGDMIQRDVPLPREIKRGELLACLTTGAYNYSMSSNYNRVPRPPIIMLSKGSSYIAVRRETPEDVAALDI